MADDLEGRQTPVMINLEKEDGDTPIEVQSSNDVVLPFDKVVAQSVTRRTLDNGDGFANVFLHEWHLAVKRVDTGRRLIESVQSFMRERANLEEAYAAGLEKLAKRLVSPASESGGVHTTIASVQSDALKRAQQANELADAIKLDIVESTLSTTIQNHYTVLKQIQSDATTISKSLSNAVNEVHKAEREVARLGREAFQIALEADRSTNSISSQQTRLAAKALAQIQELQAAETHYRRSVQIANDTKRVYGSQMKVILRSLEDMDLKRLACFKDAFRKLMVYQTSLLRNIQYDLDLTIQAVEELSEKSDVEHFLIRSRDALGLPLPQSGEAPSSSTSPPDSIPQAVTMPPELKARHWALLCLSPMDESSSALSTIKRGATPGAITVESATAAARNLLKKTPFDKVVQSAAAHLSSIGIQGPLDTPKDVGNHLPPNGTRILDPEVLMWLDGETSTAEGAERSAGHEAAVARIRREYDDLLNLIWDFTPNLSKSLWTAVEKLKEELSSSLHRSIMCQSLDEKQKEERYKLPNMDALRVLGSVVEILLAWCERQWDVVAGRALMILVQKFFAKGGPSDDPQGKATPWIWPHLRDENEEAQNEQTVVVRWFLHRVVYHLVMWNRVHFWEEALLFSISVAEQDKLLKEAEEAVTAALDTPTRPKQRGSMRIYDGLLENFGLCMLAFGIVDSQVIALIQKVCREQNLSSDFTSRLSRNISQRKDLILPFAPFEALAHPVADPHSDELKFDRAPNPSISSVQLEKADDGVEHQADPDLGQHDVFDD